MTHTRWTRWMVYLTPTLAAALFGTGCDGRVLAMGHVTSFAVAIWMFWATLNLTKPL